MITIIEDSITHNDGCMDIYVPHGSRTERQRVCIPRSNMHHYIWHCISSHCTLLSLMNLILCRWFCECLFMEVVIDEQEACCWGYTIFRVYLLSCVLCKPWTLRLGWLYASCSCGGLIGVVGVPKFCSLNLYLEVCLLSIVWLGAHPMLLQYFVDNEPESSWYLIFSSFPSLLGDL